ncbi:MAG: response regulator [Syntrophobacteraceae bacterium]
MLCGRLEVAGCGSGDRRHCPADVPGGTESILFVDDEESIAKLMRTMLERLGYKTEVVTNPGAALKLLQDAPQGFDLMMTDYTMPDLTGIALGIAVRSIRPDIPIILCTGCDDMDHREEAYRAGIHTILQKPFSRQVLAETIRQQLDAVI